MMSILNIAARVVALLFGRGPSAIIRFIVPVHVRKAIYRVNLTRARSHVSVEGGKVIGPSLTDCYAAATVQIIVIAIRVVTSVFHVKPDVVFVGPPCSFGLPVQRSVFAHLGDVELQFIATARSGHAAEQHPNRDGGMLAAVTSTVPEIGEALLGFASSVRKSENRPASKLAAFETFAVFTDTGHLKPPTRFWNWGRCESYPLAAALPILP